ncbi:MAG: exopolyphosphatase [Actinomycetaceae bacterium]|nr:exopolyphosphatase [Actinomycetaceae bacterium]
MAAIDCGTNSIRLLIGYIEDGQWVDIVRTMNIVRLGQGVDRTGMLAQEAIDRTVEQACDYAQLCRQHDVQKLRFVATSATRDAGNRDEFFAGIRAATGVEPEVISGAEEATLSFYGATGSVADIVYPALVIDIGGGSTEFVVGYRTATGVEVDCAHSFNMGSVRVTEMFPGINAEGEEKNAAIAAASRWVSDLVKQADQICDFSRVRSVIGTAGTITTIAAHALELSEYDSEAIHGSIHLLSDMGQSCQFMMVESPSVKANLGYMPAGREDVIAGGAIVWHEILTRVKLSSPSLTAVTVSDRDILDGVAHSLVTRA